MNNEKIKISLPIIVEGRYDKSTLASIFDATVITTGGFALFNSKEKQSLIKKLAQRGGVIALTDSDAGGRQIRSFLSGILPKEQIFHLYIPRIEGKERRKKTRSKEGVLGVEGMEREVLVKALSPFISTDACADSEKKTKVTKMDFFLDGLSGGENSSALRRLLAESLDLPSDMSAGALIEAINLIYSYDVYKEKLEKLKEKSEL